LSTVTVPKEVKVSVVAEEDVPKLKVEPSLIKRVFMNLILNAVQAMPSGGQLNIKIFRKDNEIFINFEDTGIGIPEENKPRIFQPLFTTKSKGQGFGLAVVQRLVEAHNGEISFESAVGKGSTFTVKLPLISEADQTWKAERKKSS
jgi:signal transduction histidine kinase